MRGFRAGFSWFLARVVVLGLVGALPGLCAEENGRAAALRGAVATLYRGGDILTMAGPGPPRCRTSTQAAAEGLPASLGTT